MSRAQLHHATLFVVLFALVVAPVGGAVQTGVVGGSSSVTGTQAGTVDASVETATGPSAVEEDTTQSAADGVVPSDISAVNRSNPELPEETSARTELAVVDTTVNDHETLARAAREEGLAVVNVSSAAEMETALANRSNLAAVHVLSHGTVGTVQIGTDTLQRRTLDQYSGLTGALDSSLAANGDVLLYGCRVAENGAGRAFVGDVANATGGDVAASDDLTGNESRGGDWELEIETGAVTTKSIEAQDYDGELLADYSKLAAGGSSPLSGFSNSKPDVEDVNQLFPIDYEGDGDTDFIVINSAEDGWHLLENDGSGGFTERTGITFDLSIKNAENFLWVDYDNDGDKDIIDAPAGSETEVAIIRNDGNGSFTKLSAGSNALSGFSSSKPEVGNFTQLTPIDYEGDGDQDFIVINSTENGWHLLENDGSGGFTERTGITFDLSVVNAINHLWVDYDNDGDKDIIDAPAGSETEAAILRNDGGGSFTKLAAGSNALSGFSNSKPEVGDYNQLLPVDADVDGDKDFVVINSSSSGHHLLENDGSGGFTEKTGTTFNLTITNIEDFLAVDYDGDGDSDITDAPAGSQSDAAILENGNSPPELSSSTPSDSQTDFSAGDDIILNFDETVSLGSGNIVVRRVSDDSAVATADVTTSEVSISGGTQVTVNPSSDLPTGTGLYVHVEPGAVTDDDDEIPVYLNNNPETLNFEAVAGNNAPTFDAGNSLALPAKKDSSSIDINSMLTASDSDGGDTLTWEVSSSPSHGSLSGFSTSESAGSSVTPSGLTYTPDGGYTGSDSFEIRVADGNGGTDTITINVDVYENVFDFESTSSGGGTSDGTDVSQTVNGVTATFEQSSSDTNQKSLFDKPRQFTGSNFAGPGFNTVTSATVTFDAPVNVNSITLGDGGVSTTTDWTLTPDGGNSQTTVTVDKDNGNVVSGISWTGVTQIDISTSSSVNLGVDDIAFTPANGNSTDSSDLLNKSKSFTFSIDNENSGSDIYGSVNGEERVAGLPNNHVVVIRKEIQDADPTDFSSQFKTRYLDHFDSDGNLVDRTNLTSLVSPRTNDFSETTVRVVPLDDGRLALFWYTFLSDRAIDDPYFRIVDPDGTALTSATQIPQNTTDLDRFSHATQLSNGNIAFVWKKDPGNLKVRIFKPDGTAVTDDINLTNLGSGYSGSGMGDSSIGANDNGEFMVLYHDKGPDTWHGILFNNDGSAKTVGGVEHFEISSTEAIATGEHVVPLTNDNFLVAYEVRPSDSASEESRFTIYDPSGSEVVGETKYMDNPGFTTTPRPLQLPTGGFVATNLSSSKLTGFRYDNSGSELTGETIITDASSSGRPYGFESFNRGFGTANTVSTTTENVRVRLYQWPTPPKFDNGSSTSLSVEKNGTASLDGTLSVSDRNDVETLEWSIQSRPSNGSLGGFSTTEPAGSSSIVPSGLTYTPDAGYSGTDSFDITISDDESSTVNDTITIKVAVGEPLSNDPELEFTTNSSDITSDDVASDGEGGAVTITDRNIDIFPIDSNITKKSHLRMEHYNGFDLLVFQDGNNNPHYGWRIESNSGDNFALKSLDFHDWGRFSGNTFEIEAFEAGVSQGSVTFSGNTDTSKITLNQGDELGSAFQNVDEVRIHRQDDSTSFIGINNIQVGTPVTNSAPTFDAGGSTTLTVENDSSNNDIGSLLTASDSDDGDTLTWTISSRPSHGSLGGFPTSESAGSSVTPSGLTYTPDDGYTGSDSFEIQVADGNGGTDTITVDVDVNSNEAPHPEWTSRHLAPENDNYDPGLEPPQQPLGIEWNTTYPEGQGVPTKPIIVNDTLYAYTYETTFALDAQTGEVLWTNTQVNGTNNGGIVYADGRLHVSTRDSGLFALNATDGTRIWNRDDIDTSHRQPVVLNGTVFIGEEGSPDTAWALDAKTGATEWNRTPGFSVAYQMADESSPTAVNGRVFFPGAPNLAAYDAADGSLLWARELGDGRSTVAVKNGTVYAGDVDVGRPQHFHALDAATGEFLWNATVDSVFVGLAVTEDTVYMATCGDSVHAYNATTGTERWNRTGVGCAAEVSEPVAAGDVLYITDWDNKTMVLDQDTGETLYNITLPGPGGGTAPVPYKGTLYIAKRESDELPTNKIYAYNQELFRRFSATSQSGQNVTVSLESTNQLTTLDISLTGPENATFTLDDFTESGAGPYTYTVTYEGSSDGEYTATLNEVVDAKGNTESGFTDTATVDTTPPTISNVTATNTSGREIESVREIELSLESNERLGALSVSVSGPETATLDLSDFSSTDENGGVVYTTSYQPSTDGTYELTVETAEDTRGNDRDVSGQSATASVQLLPLVETFDGTQPDEWAVKQDAVWAKGADGQSTLFLTDAVDNQEGLGFLDESIPLDGAVTAEFDYYMDEGDGADGLTMFLANGSAVNGSTISLGANNLRYTQDATDGAVDSPAERGIPHAYLGVGIDRFGGFAESGRCREGGPGSRPNTVSLRGAGDGGSCNDGYPYLAGTDVSDYGGVDPGWRKVRVTVVPTDTDDDGTAEAARIVVEMSWDDGQTWRRIVVHTYDEAPPETAKIGFTGATGGLNNIHAVDNLTVSRPSGPTADAGGDLTIPEDEPVTFNGSASTSENGIAAYDWRFPEGTATGETARHTFFDPGTYKVTLTVTARNGVTDTDTVNVTVTGVDDWPQYGGDVSNRGNNSDTAGVTAPTEVWNFSTSGVFAGPAVSDGTIYVSSGASVYAVDARTGAERWNFSANEVYETPAVVNGTVYFGSDDNLVYAVNADTGDQQWSFDAQAPVQAAPTVANGTVYVATSDGMFALDADTGDKEWASDVSGNFIASPAVVNGTVYAGHADNDKMYAFDAETGAREWAFPVGDGVRTPAVVVNGTVYFSDGYNNTVYAVDAQTGEQRWTFDDLSDRANRLAVAAGTVYFGSDDEKVYAVDAQTGEKEWDFDAGFTVRGQPVVVGDRVYVGSTAMYALNADTGTERWSFDAGGAIISTAAVVNGTIYFGESSGKRSVRALTSSPILPPVLSGSGQNVNVSIESDNRLTVLEVSLSGPENATLTLGDFDESGDGPYTYTATYDGSSDGTYTATVVNATDTTGNTESGLTDSVTIDTTAPTANATAESVETSVGQQVRFDASGSTDNIGIDSYEWTFGDGASGSGVSPTHVYQSPGIYTTTLTVTDRFGHTDTDTVTVTVTVDEDWPQFGDDQSRDGNNSESTGPAEIAGFDWLFDTGTGVIYGSPVVVDGIAYTGSDSGLYAVYTTNGSEKWNATVDLENEDDGLDRTYSPAYANGSVYVGTAGGSNSSIVKVDAETGSIDWSFDKPDADFMAGGTLVYDGVVYAADNGGTLWAVDAETGSEVARFSTGNAGGIESGAIAANGYVYLGDAGDSNFDSGTLHKLYAGNLTEVWETTVSGAVVADPAVSDGVVYLGDDEGNVYALDAADGSEVWSQTSAIGGTIRSSAAVTNASVFVGSEDSRVYALDRADGEVRWSYDAGDKVTASPAVVDDTVYVGDQSGDFVGLNATTGRLNWEFPVYGAPDGIKSSPAVANGSVYFGDYSNDLYKLSIPESGLPVSAAFNTDSSPGAWVVRGNATWNASVDGEQTLRLTTAENDKSGTAFYDRPFRSTSGAVVEFDYYAAGGGDGGADGQSFFLVNGSMVHRTTDRIGGSSGGSLGYAQGSSDQVDSPGERGVPHAYLGVGLDEFGNFATDAECHEGGETATDGDPGDAEPENVVLRGSGDGGSCGSGYPFLTAANVSEYGGIDGGWRRVRITLLPNDTDSDGTTDAADIRVEMSWDEGETWRSVISHTYTETPPEHLKLGFSGSTGGAVNVHAIDQVNVTKPVDLNVTVTSAPASVKRYGDVTYTYEVTNDGPNTDNTVTVTDNVTTGSNGLTNATWAYTDDDENASGLAGPPTLNLTSGETATVTVTGSVGGQADRINHTVSATPSPDFTDPAPTRASDRVDINVTEDTTAPTISNLTATNPAGQDINISFESDEQLAALTVSVSGPENATLTLTNFTADGDDPYTYTGTYAAGTVGTYTVTLDTAADAAGNDGATGQNATVTLTELDETPPGISGFNVSNPDGQNVSVSFDSNETLTNISVSISGAENATLSEESFTEDSGTYTATYVGSSDGIYTATLDTAEDAAGNDGATDQSDTVTVDTTGPIAEAGSNQTVTNGTTIQFDGTNSTDNIGITRYEWDFGDGTTATGSTPAHTYAQPGTYTVTLTVTDDAGNTDTDTLTVTVQDSTAPTADAGQSQTVTNGTTIQFDGTSSTDDTGIASYEWAFGDGTTATGPTPTHTYQQPGTYTVTLTVTDNAGNTDTDTTTITVEDATAPTAEAGSNQTVDTGTSIQFDGTGSTDNVGITSYEWNFGDGTTVTGATPTHTYQQPGTYTVTLIVIDDAGNTGRDTLTVTVEDGNAPTAEAGPNRTVDEDTPITFDGSGSTDDVGISEYEWSFGDGGDATGVNPIHTFAEPGTYTVTLTVTDDAGNTGSDTATVTVQDVTPPAADAGANTTANESDDIQFSAANSTDNVGITGYEWNFGDGTTATGETVTHTFSQDGTYTVAVTATDAAGNEGTDSLTAFIKDTSILIADAGANVTVSPDESVSLSAAQSSSNEGIASYTWTFPDGSTATGENVTQSFATPGTYQIELELTDQEGNTATDTTQVIVRDETAPSADAGANRTVTVGESVSFDGSNSTDNVGVVSHAWSFGDGTSATGVNPAHTYEEPGIYTVTLTVADAAGNTASETLTVTVQDTTAPTADAGSNRTVDEGTTVTFDGSNSSDNTGITSYEWTFGDGTTATGVAPTHTYAQPGTYTVTLTVADENNNTDTDTVTVTVQDSTAPTAEAGSNQTVTNGTTVQFDGTNSTDNTGIASYEWNFGDGTNATGSTPAHTYSQPGTYTVELTVTDDDGNTDTDTLVVTVAGSATLAIDATRTNDSVVAGNTATVAVNVTNDGPTTIQEPITLFVNGTQRGTDTVDLAPNETTSVEFQIETDPATTDDLAITIESSEDKATTIIPVSAPTDPFVVISAIETNSPVLTTNSLIVTTDLRNVGQTTGTRQITFSVANHTQQTSVTLGPNETTQETFSWNPTAGQAGEYTLEITTDRDTATADVSIVTLADATPVFNTTGLPDTLDFGTLGLTETATQTVDVQNTGNVSLRTEAKLTGNDTEQFEITQAAGDVAPGATETLTVTFDPNTRANDLTANLTINTTDPETPTRTITLRGAAKSPLISVTPADFLDFGRNTPDQAGSTISKDVTITNDGNAGLNVTNLSLESGDNFAIDTTEPLTIAAGSSRNISLTYTVPDTGGTVTDSLTITSTDPETDTVSIPLRAVVKEPSLFTQPDPIAFGDLSIVPSDTTGNLSSEQTADRRLYLENTGNARLSNLTVALTSDTKAFTLASDGDVGTLSPSDPGHFVSITAIANQTTLGEHNATLEITADELTSPVAVNATMTATTPSVNVTDTITFEDTAVGGATQTTVQIENTGNATLAVNTSAAFNSSEQQWVTTPAAGQRQLAPGETTSVRLQFAPDAATTFDGDLILRTNDPTLPDGVTTIAVNGTGITSNLTAVPSTLEFNAVGNGTRATQTLTLTNDGQSAITDLTATLAGDNADQFAVETDLTNISLASTQSQAIVVSFDPTDLGEQTAAVTFTGTDENGQTTTATVPLGGESTPPAVGLTRDAIAFGPVSVVDAPTTLTLGVANNGTQGTTLAVENVSLADASTPFEITTAPTGTDLASGERADVTLRFAPTASQTGTFSTDLRINTSDPESPTVRVPVSAEGRAPDAVVRSDHLAAGEIRVGNSTEASVTLTNDGNDVLTIESVSIEGSDAGAVALTRSHDGRMLAPGSERQIAVAVTPSQTGPLDAAVSIQTDDPLGLNYTNGTAVVDNSVPLTATGVAPALSVTPTNASEIDAGETPVGSTASESVIIENTGDAPLRIGAPGIRADSADAFTFQAGPTERTATIASGESVRYTVGFSPDTTGTATAKLVFPTTNDDDFERLAFDLTGSGIDADITVSRDTVDFDEVKRGNSTTAPLTIRNDGGVNATVTDVVIGGTDASYFETSLDAGTVIESGTTRTEAVTTTPTTTGDLSAVMGVTFSDGTDRTITLRVTGVEADPVVPETISFADTRVGNRSEESLTLGNDGNTPYTIETVSVSGDTDQFEQNLTANLKGQAVAGGDTISAPLAFAPTDSDEALDGNTSSLTVEITTDADTTTHTIAVDARSITPDFEAPDRKQFGEVPLGERVTRNITVENTLNATAPITLEDTTLGGEDPVDFEIVNRDAIAEKSLAPGESVDIEVAFTPSEPVTRSASLRLDTNDPRQPSKIVSLTNSETYVVVEFGSVMIDYFNTDAGSQPKTDVYDGIERDGAFDSFNLTAARGGDISVNFTDVAAENESDALAPGFAGYDSSEFDSEFNTVRIFDSEADLSAANFTKGTLQFRVTKATLDEAGVDITNQTDVKEAVRLFHSHENAQFETQNTTLVTNLGTSFVFETTFKTFSTSTVSIKSFNPTLDSVDIPAEISVGESITADATVTNVGGHSGDAVVELEVDGTRYDSSTHSLAAGATRTVSGLESNSISEAGTVDVTVILINDETGTEVTRTTESVSVTETTTTPPDSPGSPPSGGGSGGGLPEPEDEETEDEETEDEGTDEGETVDSGTTVSVGETGEGEPGDDEGDGPADDETDAGSDEPTPDMAVSVKNPQPGQTLVIDETGATILEQGATAASDSVDRDGDGGGDGSSLSNVRANRVTVDINTDRDFELSVTAYEDDLTPSAAIEAGTQSSRVTLLAQGASMMKVNTAPAQAEMAVVSDEVRAAARSFENQTGTVSAGYLQINTTLTPEEVTNATIEFSIRRTYLAELGVEPEEVTLYHQVAADEWESRDTAYRESGETYHRFEGTTSEFSIFALDTGASQLDVTDAALVDTTIKTGETATATATVTNRGQTERKMTINLTLDGSVVDTETVAVDGGETRDVSLSVDGVEPGEYDLAVEGIDLEPLTIEAAEEAAASPTPVSDGTPAEESDDGGPPLMALLVLIVVLLALGLWWRQTE